MSILTDLKEKKRFNESEKQLADFVIQNKNDMIYFSIQELAQKNYTSTSTIVRLCRKIGLKGYKDFKIKLAVELQKEYNIPATVDPDFPFNEDLTYQEIQKIILDLTTRSLHETYASLSAELVEEAVNMISGAHQLAIFGYGDAFLPALNFQNKMMKIGEYVQHTLLPGENRHLANNLTKEDCAIVLSYSGESKDTYFLTKILHQRGVKIIVVSAHRTSHIAQLSSLLLPITKSESSSVKLTTFSSQAAIDYVLNTVYGCIFVSNYDKNQMKRIDAEKLLLDTRFQK
ncbi:MurR/RpiR family transcriptional regulator [Lacticigenium naphthae]|uniref:MurR/RpiR family transcriptional regulator n=1 Tax=Lacticigenium naphthae TaxID=515351 RepID=UPI0003FE8CFF|nr:MurR/RpiR family transcriptional regulator [Lacticigenium naphthae]